MERVKPRKEKVLCSTRNNYHSGYRRSCIWLVVLTTCCLASCTTLKKAGVTSLGAGTGAIVGSALSGGVAAPILGGTTGAFVGDVATEVMMSSSSKGKAMTDCAPDNFWSMLGTLIEMGGWALILIFLLPIVIGWILPGPTKLNRK